MAWVRCVGRSRICMSASRWALCSLLLASVCALEPAPNQISQQRGTKWSASSAGRRLQNYIEIQWTPQIVFPPPGGGAEALFAGTNYTKFKLVSTFPTTNTGRVILTNPSAMNGQGQDLAITGNCLKPEYTYIDVLPPLNSTGFFTNHEWNSPPNQPIKFTQGGLFHLCWSEGGTFGINDGAIIPYPTSTLRVLGVRDTCSMYSWCLASRRFFCTQFHAYYAHYLPTGSQCQVFVQSSEGDLLYQRITWAEGITCATLPGRNMIDAANYVPGVDRPWMKLADPLSLMHFGHSRRDLTYGFHYLLCYCPAYDDYFDGTFGVCGEYQDFVQQVGHLSGLMASYIDVTQTAVVQIIPMTRFTVKVDCGNGPHCDTDGLERIKLVPRDWNPNHETSEDGVFWNMSTTCPEKIEVSALYSPTNCENNSIKTSDGCQMSGGTDPSVKLFGPDEVRILPLLENDRPVSQIFQICFVHKPMIPPSAYDPVSDESLQGNTRRFWKLAELVVEPLLVYDWDQWVMQKTATLRVGSPDLAKSNNLHSNSLLKVVEEDRQYFEVIDNQRCALKTTRELHLTGIACNTPDVCTPRATNIGSELIITDVTIKKAGVFAVCYCEGWSLEATACQNPDHWVLVGKFQVSGPISNEEWILDTGMVQSFFISGYGFTDESVVRILQSGQSCNQVGLDLVEPDICIFRKGGCVYQGSVTNATHMADIPGILQRWNSTNPVAVIESITAFGNDRALINFAQIPVVDLSDIIMFEDNIFSTSPHWVRARDLTRLIRGRPEGHEILDFTNAGLSAVIRMETRPLPPVIIDPPAYGKWYRSTKSKILWIKGRKELSQLSVCWGAQPGEYLTWAGYINVIDPIFMGRTAMGLTSTAAGSIAPVMLSFWTSQNPLFREPRNPTQLRITIKDSSVMELATADLESTVVGELLDADQIHEASQAMCGRLIVELWSEHEFGFPVPQGCYWDYNRYDSDGKIRSLFILFEPLNGLTSLTKYTLVLNMHLVKPMTMADYDALDEPLIEIAALDDIIVKPEGILEIGYANPDKAVTLAAQPSGHTPRFYHVGSFSDNVTGNITVGPSIMGLLDVAGQSLASTTHPLLYLQSDQVGFSFLLRGDEVGNITRQSLIRFFMWPLTAWELNYGSACTAKCTPQTNTECKGEMECSYEATQSVCRDVIPPGGKIWTDNRGRTCEFYAVGQRCQQDGSYYTPVSGIDAVDACCVCNGGERLNSNVVKIRLPKDMDDAFGFDVIHTIRVYQIAPVTPRGFFATRWGAQLTTSSDLHPHYTVTTSAYFAKTPEIGSYSTVSTLLGVDTWGNSRPFAAEKNLNDFYLRIQFPVTVFGVPGYGNPSGASLTITMPKGFQCKYVHPAVPRGTGDDTVPMPVLPTDPPNGNGALPDSTSGEGNALGYNSSAIIIGTPSGQWEFIDNQCIFHFSPYMVYHEKQTLYAHIFAINPLLPMPYEDPDNFWTVGFVSRGSAGKPAGIVDTAPCNGATVNNPPFCYATGVDYYVNPLGYPSGTQSYLTLWPTAEDLTTTAGPYIVMDMDGDELNRTWTDRFVVLGRLSEVIGQAFHFHLGATTVMQFWFIPDLGSHRDGILSITFPIGFVVADPCYARNLSHAYYTTFSPPFDRHLSDKAFYHTTFPKIWPLDEIKSCGRLTTSNTAAISVDGAMVSGRYYGFEIDVTTPPMSEAAALVSSFIYKLFIRDNFGRGRDGTYTTAVFDPHTTTPKVEFGDAAHLYYTGTYTAVSVVIDSMKPSNWTTSPTKIQILNISFNTSVRGRLRVTAPPGFRWSWGDFFISGLPGQTRAMPGGVPPLPSSLRPNIIEWNIGNLLYEAYETYAFETTIEIPEEPVRSSSNRFFLEWGFDGTQVYFNNSGQGRTAYASIDAPKIQALRGFKVEASTTVAGETALLWFWFETITPIPANASLEMTLPMPDQYFQNVTKWDSTGGEYIQVYTVDDYNSDLLPIDFQCRKVFYPNAWNVDQTGFEMEIRLEMFSEGSVIEPGRYVLEFTTINSNLVVVNGVANDNPCGVRNCYTLYSNNYRPLVALGSGPRWMSQETPFRSAHNKQNDYWTSIPAPRITRKMRVCEIVDMPVPEFLDQRLAVGRNDRPGQRSALVFAFMLDEYFSTVDDTLNIRAPIGFLFDSICDFYVNDDIYPTAPGSNGMPTSYQLNDQSASHQVESWPSFAPPTKCRGDGHLARIWFGRGLIPTKLYMFRITLRRNPILTPARNTWMVSYGGESSGEMPGFPLWTFPDSYLDPVSLSWTLKPDPQRSSVVFHFNPVNTLVQWTPSASIWSAPATLQPLIRIIMPPLYELLVDAEDQDIQGGACFAVIQEVGDCCMCGAPFRPEVASCTREWNRKNVAHVKLLGDTTIHGGRWYSIALTLFNPHIVDAFEGDARHWVIESFLGQPWPLQSPLGYELDHRNVSGYKIAEKADLTVETPSDRNGSASVYDQEVSFQFTDAITEGNTVLLRAPVGYVTTRLIKGIIDQIVCIGIEFGRPSIYRTERDPATGNDTVVLPPKRAPIPNPVPDWANNTAVIESQADANISNATGTMWEYYNFTITRPYCLVDRWRNTSLGVNETYVISDNFNWLDPPEGTVLNMTLKKDINQTLFPGMWELCLQAHWTIISIDDENGTLAFDANYTWGCDPCCHLRSVVGFRLDRDLLCCSNATLSQYNDSTDLCPTESFHHVQQLCTLIKAATVPPGADLMSFRIVENPYARVRPRPEAGRGVERDESGNLPFGAFDASAVGEPPPSRRLQFPRFLNETSIGDGGEETLDNTPSQAIDNEDCSNATINDTNCSNATLFSTTQTATTTMVGPEICIGGVAVYIFWATAVNITSELQNWTADRDYALTMENWDRYPLQGEPVCSGRDWTWTVRKQDIHPDGPKMLNGTRLFFRISYQNARRPPLQHENFWMARHYRIVTNVGPFAGKLQVSSSAAVASWTIVSRLTYVNVEILSEVLQTKMPPMCRAEDTATFHFEFVTVNLADRLKIVAHSPPGFDFGQAFMSSPTTWPGQNTSSQRLLRNSSDLYKSPNEFDDMGHPWESSRRLQQRTIEFDTPYTWKGYTLGIQILSAAGNTIELKVSGNCPPLLARDEYTRFRISGIKIPSLGGQSLFNFESTLYNEPADSMYNCCPPGYPPNNPGYSPKIPYRMDPISSIIRNTYQLSPLVFPILRLWETRFNELTRASFTFQIPSPHQSVVPNAYLVLIIRAPQGYVIDNETVPIVQVSGCVKIDGETVCGFSSTGVIKWRPYRTTDRRIELALPDLSVMTVGTEYRTELTVHTPITIFDRADSSSPESLWVLELNDANSLDNGRVSTTLGAPCDFILNDTLNFTAEALDTPPDTIVVVDITFKDAGEIPPTMVQVYAPEGYTFVKDCFAPGVMEEQDVFVSCRERWSLFGAQYLSGAVMATGGLGVRRSVLPMTIKLLVKTPLETPSENKWFTRAKIRTGPTAWGVVFQPFPVRQMTASLSMLAIAGVRVTAFLSVFFRYPLPWGGHVHIVAPKTYQLFCPVLQVLSGLTEDQKPTCSETDPLLAGCWGLPSVDDPSAAVVGIPNCDPRHELLLTFPLPTTTTSSTQQVVTTLFAWSAFGQQTTTTTTTTTIGIPLYALPAGSSMLLALEARVPMETPAPRSENIFKIRILDAGKVTIDGKVNQYGETVRKVPKVDDFSLWWNSAVPNTISMTAVHFWFNNSRGDLWREDEIVKVIDVVAPEGFAMAVRRPCDIANLADDSISVPVSNWSWSTVLPRHIWFTLDPSPAMQNFTGYFHFAFPVLTPTKEVGIPLDNLWRIKLCGDQPYCYQKVLDIPIPGFFFGDTPSAGLSEGAMDKLVTRCGNGERTIPTWRGFALVLFLWQLLQTFTG